MESSALCPEYDCGHSRPPPCEQSDRRPARAHEAEAVNEIKRKQLFTVVIGNPPYSINSCNLQESAVENVTITIDSFGAVTP